MFKLPQKARFGEQTPPAIFPPIFGLLGIGLAWRRAEPVFQAPPAVSQLILGAVSLLFLFALGAYGLKVIRRPAVVAEDLRVLPGRAGLAAMVLSVYLMAAVLLPMNPRVAAAVLLAGLAGHAALVWLVIAALLRGPEEQRQVTPVWHLQFVGVIFVPLVAIPLGYTGLSRVIFYGAGAFALAILAISVVQVIRRDPPPPLRPLMAIHVAPFSLLGTVALMLNERLPALIFAALATAILAALLIRARYITAAGFSPLWGAFTFPLAAYASLMLALAGAGEGEPFRFAGGVTLVAGTLMIPAIAVKVMQAWAKGGLAVKTNAARA